ncbi:MAG: hypothetical protein HY901_16245 [Deltaproteobacteria bacterium]|nr:hypothetical protein [Deltaproteobacteria bacterium]
MERFDQPQQGLVGIGYDRVRAHTPNPINEQIDSQTRARLAEVQELGPVQVGRRLADLDREWDVDRTLMAMFPILGGTTFALGLRAITARKKGNGWLYLFGTQMAFMMLHAVAGWCPPVSVLRRLGIRTQREITLERQSLLAGAGSAAPGISH